MASPFPGMDPYLEDPEIWSGVHAAILAEVFNRLGPALRPKYVVRYEERVYITGEEDPGIRAIIPDVRIIHRQTAARLPQVTQAGVLTVTEPIPVALADDEIHERSLVILDPRDHKIVTVIELLSPTNKVLNSFGRESFLRKRREIRTSAAHWMEIDLLRGGARTANLPGVPETEYQVYLSMAGAPCRGFAWPIPLKQRLPVIRVPLRGDDPDVPLDLQDVLDVVVKRGSYDLETDYTLDPVPTLSTEAAVWAKQLIGSWSPGDS